ncbi:hypothetical protein WM33_20285 [Burkholderia multivorans]|nr:hypothetical protein WM33_20285 [Burkholderia multivorans]KVZ75276.1 hypothetical protein WL23_23905 [Burkholderia multivorans]
MLCVRLMQRHHAMHGPDGADQRHSHESQDTEPAFRDATRAEPLPIQIRETVWMLGFRRFSMRTCRLFSSGAD